MAHLSDLKVHTCVGKGTMTEKYPLQGAYTEKSQCISKASEQKPCCTKPRITLRLLLAKPALNFILRVLPFS